MDYARLVRRQPESPDVLGSLSRFSIDCIGKILATVRTRLAMDVAFVSEFIGAARFVRHVDVKARRSPIKVGEVAPVDSTYCGAIVYGSLPELIPDTAAFPEAMALHATRATPIGSHLGVALRLSDGRVFGTFCCFSFKANPKLDEHGLDLLRAFADLIVYQIETDSDHFRIHAEKKARIQAALDSGQPSIVYQPVFRLSDSAVVGAEALSRFGIGPQRSPDIWFSEAGDVGLKTELELTAVNSALSKYRSLWKRGPMYLGLNSSPQTISSGGVLNAIEGFPADRIILEITEHDFVENYDDLLRALVPLRMRGVKIAVDDAGSGYASMRHILNVHPDYIKLDISLTHDIGRDGTRRALARSLIEFGRETQCKIVAEGVETEAEMAVLRELGVYAAQGYLLARPISIEELWRLVL